MYHIEKHSSIRAQDSDEQRTLAVIDHAEASSPVSQLHKTTVVKTHKPTLKEFQTIPQSAVLEIVWATSSYNNIYEFQNYISPT